MSTSEGPRKMTTRVKTFLSEIGIQYTCIVMPHQILKNQEKEAVVFTHNNQHIVIVCEYKGRQSTTALTISKTANKDLMPLMARGNLEEGVYYEKYHLFPSKLPNLLAYIENEKNWSLYNPRS